MPRIIEARNQQATPIPLAKPEWRPGTVVWVMPRTKIHFVRESICYGTLHIHQTMEWPEEPPELPPVCITHKPSMAIIALLDDAEYAKQLCEWLWERASSEFIKEYVDPMKLPKDVHDWCWENLKFLHE